MTSPSEMPKRAIAHRAEITSPEARLKGKPAAFLDRDGVINVDTGYPHRPEELLMIPGAAQAIRALNQAGFAVIVVSNQSGVARGYFTEQEVHNFNEAIQKSLQKDGARIDVFCACFFHPQAIVPAYRMAHPNRKPAPGMITSCMQQYELDKNRSFLIGDRPTDLTAAQRAGIPGHLYSGPNLFNFLTSLDVIPMRE